MVIAGLPVSSLLQLDNDGHIEVLTSLLQKDENISHRFWVTILLPAFHIYAGMASAPGARCLAFFSDALEFTIAGNKDFHFDSDVALT